ncbi:MAG: phosphopentomutase [Clostridiales Family XIII bacterium]|jgi:phosphopentomutase|nr:phosphopentomutase [Clostridiales Family XIII bacterium]
MKRVTIIVIDSLGVGALPDAADYGDAGADTLLHILEASPGLQIPNLLSLGLGNISGAAGGRHAVPAPRGAYARLFEASKGKDTITGHWEIAGLLTEIPFKTRERFPDEFMRAFETRIGVGTLGNRAASGTVIIEELGPEHERTGKPIVYTSADSVFQIAANTAVIPLERLYEICRAAREMLMGDLLTGRVIARPYVSENGKRIRSSDRKDYAVSPGGPTLLDHVKEAGLSVCAIGKIGDIFNGRGITEAIHTDDNADGVDKTVLALKRDFGGLIFTNLVDFDSKFGHRRDARGYGGALEAFDARLPELTAAMGEDEMLILCADHGNDPVHTGWDHTREAVPALLCGRGVKPVDLGTRSSFADIGATAAEALGAAPCAIGKSFLAEISK